MDRDPHLPSTGMDVGGAIVVQPEEGPVCRRRLGELVDLLAEGGDVLSRLTERVGQLLVLGHGLRQLALGLEQPLFQGADALRCVGEALPELQHLVLQAFDLTQQRLGVGLAGGVWSIAGCHLCTPVLVRRGPYTCPAPHRCRSPGCHETGVGPETFARELPRQFNEPVGCQYGPTGQDPEPHSHRRKGDTDMKVWIDQDLCTGDGLCEEIAPDVFALLDDGLAYVKDGDKILSEPGGAEAVAPVPAGQEEATIESAEECPGECIFIEV